MHRYRLDLYEEVNALDDELNSVFHQLGNTCDSVNGGGEDEVYVLSSMEMRKLMYPRTLCRRNTTTGGKCNLVVPCRNQC